MTTPAMSGVHTALVTPFREGQLDHATLEAQIERQIVGGVQGLVPCGTTGESPTLDQAEWAQVVGTAVRLGKGRVTVTAGVGTNNTWTSVRKAEAALKLGADAGLLVLPYYNKPNPAGLKQHVAAVAAVGLPLVVYHVPGRTAQRVEPALLAELLATPGVVGCKEATGDLTYGQDLMVLTDRPVLSGDDFTWMPLCTVGGAGVISVLSNVAPAETSLVWSRLVAGDLAGAAQVHRRLYPLVKYLFAEVNPVPVKAAMAAMGLGTADVRLPLAPGQRPPAGLLDGRH